MNTELANHPVYGPMMQPAIRDDRYGNSGERKTAAQKSTCLEVITVWRDGRQIGSVVEILMPGRTYDNRQWLADVHDFDEDQPEYDPIRLGIYEDPMQMMREMLERAS